MLSVPLITRELRVQSRLASTYKARVGWGLAAVALLLFFAINFPAQINDGRYVLSAIHFCLVVMLLILAPLGASDAISREKREGTLGLLFLTKLTPTQVVLGKVAAHLIRLFYLVLMMLPFLMLPVLLGSISLREFLVSALTLFAIAAAGLGAGLIASAIFMNFGAALFCAMILTLLISFLISSSVANAALAIFANRFFNEFDLAIRVFLLGPTLMVFPVFATQVASTFVASRWFIWLVDGGLLALAISFLGFAVIFCKRAVARHSEFAGETKRQADFREKFLTPVVWRKTFRRFMSRKLDRNPLIWLEYRTAWARSAQYAMILSVIVIETGLQITMPNRLDFGSAHFFMISMLVVLMTFKSSSSFQSEKESGAFELILVTPFTERKLWAGRLRAVASYYGLAVVLLAGLGLYSFRWSQPAYEYQQNVPSPIVNFTSMCASLVSVPVAGLFFALRCKSFVGALFGTAGIAVLAPVCLWAAFFGLLWMFASMQQNTAVVLYEFLRAHSWPALLAVILYHLVVIILCSRAGIRLLRRRQFVTGP